MSRPTFSFKEDIYDFKELYSMALTNKNIFKSGEVCNNSTGEVFDISEIFKVKKQYYELLNEITNTIGNEHDRRIAWAKLKEDKESLFKQLKNKYEENKISIDEMKEYLELKKDIEPNFIKGRQMFALSYDNFITLNIGERIPKSVKYIDKGRFYDMLCYLSYDNQLKHTPRKNGRIIKKEDLIEALDFKDYSVYRKFITTLIKNNLIKEIPTSNKTKVIIINPIYANRNIRIDYTTYLTFKNDISRFLTKEEIYYLELLGTKDELIGSYEIE